MRLLAVACVLIGSFCFAAPKGKQKEFFHKDMNPTELFEWVLKQPVKDKPWRKVLEVESVQDDPVEWGWNVSSALSLALKKKYPEIGLTAWEVKVMGVDPEKVIDPYRVSASIFHAMITKGECGPVKAEDW